MDDRIMKYLNIGLGVAIAIVAIVAGVMFWRSKAAEADLVAQQEAVSEELTEAATEDAGTEASYIDIPGWTDREDVKGDKEGISLEEASKASSSSSAAASTTKKSTSSTAASTTKTTNAASTASTTTNAAATASTDAAAAASTEAATANAWKTDATYHWKETNGTVTDKVAHTFNSSGTCMVCGYQLSWQHTSTYHYHLVNGEVADKADHTLSNGVCTVCGYKASQTGNVGASAYNWDGTYHWHIDSNGKIVDKGEHQKYYNSDGTCTVCGYSNPDLAGTSDLKWVADGGAGHYKDKNGAKVQYAAHTFNDKGVCTVCGYAVSGYGYDASGHWFKNMGVQATDTVAHTFSGHKCTVCGYVSDHEWKDNGDSNHKCSICGETASHTYGSDGKCTVCGHYSKSADTTQVPETPSDGSSTGDSGSTEAAATQNNTEAGASAVVS